MFYGKSEHLFGKSNKVVEYMSISHGADDTGIITNSLIFSLAVLFPLHKYVSVSGFTVNASLGDVVVLCILLLFVGGFFGHHYIPNWSLIIFSFVAYATATIGIVMSLEARGYHSPLIGTVGVVKLLGGLTYFFAVFTILLTDTRRRLWLFLVSSVGASTIFAAFSIYQSIFGSSLRAEFPYEDPNIYATYLVLNVSFVLTILSLLDGSDRTWHRRLIAIVSLPILSAAILATASRSILFGLGVGAAFYIFRYLPASKVTLIPDAKSLVGVGFLGLGFLYTNPFVVERILQVFSHGVSIGPRIHLWRKAAEAFLANPVLGIGFRQFATYSPLLPDVHNTYLQIAAETGIIGLGLFLLVLIVIVRDSSRLKRYEGVDSKYLVLFVIVVLAQGVFINIENFRSFWLCIGMLAAIRFSMAKRIKPIPHGFGTSSGD